MKYCNCAHCSVHVQNAFKLPKTSSSFSEANTVQPPSFLCFSTAMLPKGWEMLLSAMLLLVFGCRARSVYQPATAATQHSQSRTGRGKSHELGEEHFDWDTRKATRLLEYMDSRIRKKKVGKGCGPGALSTCFSASESWGEKGRMVLGPSSS
jgi:hypothetical protein